MRTIYETLEVANKDGKYYNIYNVPENLPIAAPFTWLSPSTNLINPKFDWKQGVWVDDEIEILKSRVNELETKIKELEMLSK